MWVFSYIAVIATSFTLLDHDVVAIVHFHFGKQLMNEI